MQTRYLNFDPLTEESLASLSLNSEKGYVDSYAKFREKVNSIIAERKDPDFQAKWKNGTSPIPHYIFLFASRKKRSAFYQCFPKMILLWGYQQSFYMMNSIICRISASIL